MAAQWVLLDDNGDIVAWKAVVGAKHSHAMARPVFPRHQPNYSFDKGVVIRIRALCRAGGTQPLEADSPEA